MSAEALSGRDRSRSRPLLGTAAGANAKRGGSTGESPCHWAWCAIATRTCRMARLRGELEIVGAQPARDLPAVARPNGSALAETWQKTELLEEKSDVIHAIYERIVIEGRASLACA